MSIPVPDAAGLDTCLPAPLVAFRAARAKNGFACLTGHPIAPARTNAVFNAPRRFQALPRAAKQAIALDRNHRGHIATDTSPDVNSTLAEATKPYQSDSFLVMRREPPGPARHLSGPNQWPDRALAQRGRPTTRPRLPPFLFDHNGTATVTPLPDTGTPRFDPVKRGAFPRAEARAGYNTHKDTPSPCT